MLYVLAFPDGCSAEYKCCSKIEHQMADALHYLAGPMHEFGVLHIFCQVGVQLHPCAKIQSMTTVVVVIMVYLLDVLARSAIERLLHELDILHVLC